MFLTGSWQILRGERAIRTLTWIQHWQPLSSPFFFFLHFLSFSLTHPFSRTYSLASSRSHIHFHVISLWKSQSHYISSPRVKGKPSHDSSSVTPHSLAQPGNLEGRFFRRDYPCKERYISPCVCVPAAGMGGTVWGECDCMRELPVLQPIWQTLFFCVLTSGGNRGGLFPQPPCSTGITLVYIGAWNLRQWSYMTSKWIILLLYVWSLMWPEI